MNANQLLFYLRGFLENQADPTPAQIHALRNEVLRAEPVEAEIIPVEVVNPIKRITSTKDQPCGGCGGH